MNRFSLFCCAALSVVLAGCVSERKYDALETKYNQLNQQLSGEVASDQVRITRLQSAVKIAVNSELLFPSGGWQMPRDAQQLIARIAPILAPIQETQLLVNGYTDNVPIGADLRARGVKNNEDLSLRRAQNVADYLISQGVKASLVYVKGFGDAEPVASNDTPAGRAKNRRVELTLNGSGN